MMNDGDIYIVKVAVSADETPELSVAKIDESELRLLNYISGDEAREVFEKLTGKTIDN